MGTRLDGEPLSEVARMMASCQPGSFNDQTAKAEFFLRQTQFQEKVAKAAEETAKQTSRSVKYMLWSVIALTASVIVKVVFDLISFFN